METVTRVTSAFGVGGGARRRSPAYTLTPPITVQEEAGGQDHTEEPLGPWGTPTFASLAPIRTESRVCGILFYIFHYLHEVAARPSDERQV